ncbi:MAG: hypothetical protein COA69_07530 [Robiginitomaculum sp.]|nr:MAG: hypothetical protein COA69_07530 [Robiginitomaculum sp.]
MTTQVDNNKALNAASTWFARLMADDVSEAERAGFIIWLSESEAHKTAYEDICVTWGEVDGLDTSVLETLSAKALPQTLHANNDRKTGFKWLASSLAAAAVLIVAFVGMPMLNTVLGEQSPVEYAYTTGHGETRTVTLADGSEITLNTDTSVRAMFNQGTRKVILERGEAFFDVVRDETRPFTVGFGGGRVTVLGTRFNVYRQEAGTQVFVEHGRVEVSGLATPNTLILAVDQGANLDVNGELSTENAFVLEQAIAWKNGNFVFRDTKLSDMATQINRYARLDVIIEDEAVKNLEISGTFAINRIPEILTTLELAMPVDVEVQSDGKHLIVAR